MVNERVGPPPARVKLGNRRRILWIGVVVFMLALAGLKHWLFPAAAKNGVLTAPTRIADIEETVLASGTIEPSKLVSVGAQASGRIVAMHARLGDAVRTGELIAEIDPSTERNALQNAEAALAQERAQRASRAAALKLAELAFDRASDIFAKAASARADYEIAEATYDGTKADVAALDAQIRQAVIAVDTARVTLAFTKVLSPMDGTVMAIVAPEGQTVNAVQAAPTIVKLADLETMTVKAQISEADVMRVHPGQDVFFTVLGAPEHRYNARLAVVEPAPESIRNETGNPGGAAASGNQASSAVYYNGLFDIANPDHALRMSMTAQVNIIVNEVKGALSIPVDALGETRADGRRMVRIVDAHGKRVPRWVQVGANDHSLAQVLDGLTIGEQVIVEDLSARANPPKG